MGAPKLSAPSWMGFLPSGGPEGSRLGLTTLGGFYPWAAASLAVPGVCGALLSFCGQLVGIKSALGAVQLRVLDAPSRMWVSGSGSERRGALLYGSAAWVDFQSHPEWRSPLSFGSSQLASCSKMLFDTPRLVHMERRTARKLLLVVAMVTSGPAPQKKTSQSALSSAGWGSPKSCNNIKMNSLSSLCWPLRTRLSSALSDGEDVITDSD